MLRLKITAGTPPAQFISSVVFEQLHVKGAPAVTREIGRLQRRILVRRPE
jgi:hypothetical protein